MLRQEQNVGRENRKMKNWRAIGTQHSAVPTAPNNDLSFFTDI